MVAGDQGRPTFVRASERPPPNAAEVGLAVRRMAAATDDLDDSNEYLKPKMSYAQLICEAIINSEHRMLTLSEIYTEIQRRHPFYSTQRSGKWQNSVRHVLSLNHAFGKVLNVYCEGKGGYWTVEKGAEDAVFKRRIYTEAPGSLTQERP